MSNKVLCVDDDVNILSAYKRQLYKQFDIHTAEGGQQGLAAIDQQGPFAVIVSDLRMPGMDGIEFLTKARDRAPNSVRVMLTGQADMEDAIRVVNEGNIFRFLTKPCPPEYLSKTLNDGIAQYRLINAERVLLQKTLHGSIKMLTDVLSLINPEAFSKATRVKRYVHHILTQFGFENSWKYEVAAMLSLIGYVSLPYEIVQKLHEGQLLTEDEQNMYMEHPGVASNLLANIPRLESIAQMIAHQQKAFNNQENGKNSKVQEEIKLGAQLLRISFEFDKLISQGLPPDIAVVRMMRREDIYDTRLVQALENIDTGEVGMEIKEVTVSELTTVMVLAENVKTRTGLLLATKGQDVSCPVRERLRNFARSVGISEPIAVLVPRKKDED